MTRALDLLVFVWLLITTASPTFAQQKSTAGATEPASQVIPEIGMACGDLNHTTCINMPGCEWREISASSAAPSSESAQTVSAFGSSTDSGGNGVSGVVSSEQRFSTTAMFRPPPTSTAAAATTSSRSPSTSSVDNGSAVSSPAGSPPLVAPTTSTVTVAATPASQMSMAGSTTSRLTTTNPPNPTPRPPSPTPSPTPTPTTRSPTPAPTPTTRSPTPRPTPSPAPTPSPTPKTTTTTASPTPSPTPKPTTRAPTPRLATQSTKFPPFTIQPPPAASRKRGVDAAEPAPPGSCVRSLVVEQSSNANAIDDITVAVSSDSPNIVGYALAGVFGGLLVCVLAIVAIVWLLKRQRSQSRSSSDADEQPSIGSVQPGNQYASLPRSTAEQPFSAPQVYSQLTKAPREVSHYDYNEIRLRPIADDYGAADDELQITQSNYAYETSNTAITDN